MKTQEKPPEVITETNPVILQTMLLEANKKINLLQEQIAWLTRQIFGKKSEKVIGDLMKAPDLFDGFSFGQTDAPISPEELAKPEPKKRRKPIRDGKNAIVIPSNLPVETIIIDLPEDQKICKETGMPLEKIGEERTLKLAHKPGCYFIKEFIRFKYANPQKEEQGIFCPELPTTIFPKSKADDSLLAEVLVKKFGDHLPLYRIAEIMGRDGVEISRKLLSQWVMYCGGALAPIYNEMLKRIKASGNIFVDESPVSFCTPKSKRSNRSKGKCKKGYMWVIAGGNEKNPPYRICSFAENRCHAHIFKMLEGYKGALHSDKYGSYVTLSKNGDIIWMPCWAHIRRYFFEIEFGDLDFCNLVLKQIRYLYMFERVAWNRSPEERLKIRQEKEAPIIDLLITMVKEKVAKGGYLPKSKFAQALHYFIGLIPHLKNYTKYEFARIDNNVAERTVRPLAIGRKNWLFFGSLEAGEHAAVVISIIQTCRALGINPREYLEDIFRKLPDHNAQKVYELLPDQWLLNRQKSK